MGRILSGPLAQAQPQLAIASPLNDVQLVALIAALGASGHWAADRQDPSKAVVWAVEVVSEAIAQASGLKLAQAAKSRQEAQQADGG